MNYDTITIQPQPAEICRPNATCIPEPSIGWVLFMGALVLLAYIANRRPV